VRPDTFSRLVEYLRSVGEGFPDERTGAETVYFMADAALGAFSVFFMQPTFRALAQTICELFLAYFFRGLFRYLLVQSFERK
jgi:hypothetical protein